MGRTWGHGMARLSLEEQQLVLCAHEELKKVATQGAPEAIFDALRACTPITGGFVGSFTRGGTEPVASHPVKLPVDLVCGWFDAPRQQLFTMLAPLLNARGGQLISDREAITGKVRDEIELIQIVSASGLGETAGYMVSDPAMTSRSLKFLTFALDESAQFTPKDHIMLGLLRDDIHAALERVRLPLISSQSITAQIMEDRKLGFVLVAPKSAQCVEMNLRARELVAKYVPAASFDSGKYVMSSFAIRALFETKSKDSWIIAHRKGGELEVTVHELKKEEHAIGEDLWLVMLEETLYPGQADFFSPLGLTSREEEIAIYLVTTGLSYKEIADRLGTKYHTVRTQINCVYRKAKVHSRNELTAKLKGYRPS